MSKISILSELRLYRSGKNSTHARWIADKLLKALELGIVSEVDLEVLDAGLADDYGKFVAYQQGKASAESEAFACIRNAPRRGLCSGRTHHMSD